MKKNIFIFLIILVISCFLLGTLLFFIFPRKKEIKIAPSPLPSPSTSLYNPPPLFSPTPLPPAAQDHAADLQNQYNKTNQPDIFLSNKVPYDAPAFSITADFQDAAPQHFFFTIQVKTADQTAGKQAVTTWLHSLGLGDTQIAQLDLRYQ